MKVDVVIHIPQLDFLNQGVLKNMSAVNDRIKAAVAKTTSLRGSLQQAFDAYAQRIRDNAAGAPNEAELNTIADDLENANAGEQSLVDSIIAATPAANTEPSPASGADAGVSTPPADESSSG